MCAANAGVPAKATFMANGGDQWPRPVSVGVVPVRARPPEAHCAPPPGAANIVSVGVVHRCAHQPASRCFLRSRAASLDRFSGERWSTKILP